MCARKICLVLTATVWCGATAFQGAAAEPPRVLNNAGRQTFWFADALAQTTDPDKRRSLVRQLAKAPSVPALELSVQLLQQDLDLREEAAAAAVCIGSNLADSERQRVKAAMQKVIALSQNVDTIKQADMALRAAARSVNLALNAAVSSPDNLEPDGGSGPDAAAVDGKRATYWDETDNQPLYRFRVQFPNPTNVNTVIIAGHAYHSHSPKDFEVLCDDQVVATITSADYDQKSNETHVRFPRCACSSLELKITGYYGGSPGLRELEVYDVDTGSPWTSYTPLPAGEHRLSWQRDEGRLALLNYSRTVWAFHYGREAAKPCFDPLGLVDGVSLIWKSPPDHPWHHGLWFSWKEINGVNYWEEDATTGLAAGLTEVISSQVSAGDDFAARIELQLQYHPPGRRRSCRRSGASGYRPPMRKAITHWIGAALFKPATKTCCSKAARPAEATRDSRFAPRQIRMTGNSWMAKGAKMSPVRTRWRRTCMGSTLAGWI